MVPISLRVKSKDKGPTPLHLPLLTPSLTLLQLLCLFATLNLPGKRLQHLLSLLTSAWNLLQFSSAMKASQTTLYPFTILLPPQHISLPNVSYVVCSRYCLPHLLSVSPAREKAPLEQEALPGLFLLHPPNLAQDLVQDEQLIQHLTNFVFSLSSGLMSHHSNITVSSKLAIGPFFQDLKHVIFLQTWKPLQIPSLLPGYLLTLFSIP